MSEVGQDSSMEDILASIKRVIAEDVKPAGQRAVRPRTDTDDDDDDDVLELDASLMQLPPVPPQTPAMPASPAPSLVSPTAAEAARIKATLV